MIHLFATLKRQNKKPYFVKTEDRDRFNSEDSYFLVYSAENESDLSNPIKLLEKFLQENTKENKSQKIEEESQSAEVNESDLYNVDEIPYPTLTELEEIIMEKNAERPAFEAMSLKELKSYAKDELNLKIAANTGLEKTLNDVIAAWDSRHK